MVSCSSDEPSVVIDHTEKPLQLFDCSWRLDLFDGLNFGRQRLNAVLVAEVTEKFNLRNAEDAFLPVNDKTIGFQNGKDSSQILQMFLRC